MIFKYADCNKWPYIYVVFSNGGGNIKWLKFLKPGFKHCFIVLGDGTEWIAIEATLSRTFINEINDTNYIESLKAKGFSPIRSKIYQSQNLHSPRIGIFSCVELVKSILGIKNLWLQTPYHLYKFLNKSQMF